jgi:hypothetical protein
LNFLSQELSETLVHVLLSYLDKVLILVYVVI